MTWGAPFIGRAIWIYVPSRPRREAASGAVFSAEGWLLTTAQGTPQVAVQPSSYSFRAFVVGRHRYLRALPRRSPTLPDVLTSEALYMAAMSRSIWSAGRPSTLSERRSTASAYSTLPAGASGLFMERPIFDVDAAQTFVGQFNPRANASKIKGWLWMR